MESKVAYRRLKKMNGDIKHIYFLMLKPKLTFPIFISNRESMAKRVIELRILKAQQNA